MSRAASRVGDAVPVSRDQVIAYRVAAHGLHRDTAAVRDLAVLKLGVQEAMGHPAGLALAARLPSSVELRPAAVAAGPGHRLAMAWTVRGAPHLHHRRDLDALAGALWPLSEADAATRLNETGPAVTRSGIAALRQFDLTVAAMAAVTTAPTAKSAASTAVTERLPVAMRRDCQGCGTAHVSDSAMRATMLGAGLELEPGTSPPVLLPRSDAARPTGPDVGALTRFAHTFLALHGPAGPGEFAGHLGARRADIAQHWPTDVVAVDVVGRRAWLSEKDLERLRSAPPPDVVRLLGPFDPYLQARDRELIVPDAAARRTLWPVLGRPGAVFVDGEVMGAWRTRAAGAQLTITVETFGPLRSSAWGELEIEARRVAEVRGCTGVQVLIGGR